MGSKKIKVTVNTNTNTHKSVFWVLCCETLLLLTWTLPNQLYPNTDLGPCIFKRNKNSHSLIICCKCFSTHSQMDLLILFGIHFILDWPDERLHNCRTSDWMSCTTVCHHSLCVYFSPFLPFYLSWALSLSLSLLRSHFLFPFIQFFFAGNWSESWVFHSK